MNLALIEGKNLELKKHVNAIHCSNNLTLVQRKLFNALLFNAYPDLPYKQRFHIRGKDLYKLIGYNSKDTGKLKAALLGLITIAIEWNVIDCSTKQEKKWKASSILASAELSEGMCIYEYSQVMKEFLYQPEIYGRINIELVSRFKSNYGLALYENCIRYQGLAQTPWFPLEIFRKLMGVLDGKYTAFKDFKKRVIDIAVNEINVISPITIEPELERINQKVTKIRFKLDNNIINKSKDISLPILNYQLNNILTNTFGFSQKMIIETLAKYELSYIQEKVEIITQSNNFLAGKIRGLAGYLLEALKKDYQPSKSSKVIVNELRIAKEVDANNKKLKDENHLKRYEMYISKKINTYISQLTKAQNEGLIAEFEIYLQNQNRILQDWYNKHEFDHPGIKGCFYNFIREHKKNQLGEILSKEDFISLINEYN